MFRFLRDLSNKIIEKKEVKIGVTIVPKFVSRSATDNSNSECRLLGRGKGKTNGGSVRIGVGGNGG